MIISIIGSRGIPAKYGGYEIFVEELSTRLVKKGFSVTVCCEYDKKRMATYEGIKLKYLPYAPPRNYTLRKFYEILNDTYFMVKMARSSDAIYVLGTAAGGMMFLPKLLNRNVRTLVNIGGLEWKRDKWNRVEKLLFKLNTLLAITFADTVIVDSKSMKKYVGQLGNRKTTYISYGANVHVPISWDKIKLVSYIKKNENLLNIEKNNYWLEIARLEPDNNIHIVIKGFLKSKSKKQLIIIGDYTSSAYRNRIEKILQNDYENRVSMLGGIYDNRELLEMLRQNCYAYIHAHSFGGTNPSLLEAMASKIVILAHDNEFNREVCDDSALYFKNENDLAKKIEFIEHDGNIKSKLKDKVYERVLNKYSWEIVVENYISIFNDLISTN